MSEVPLNMLEPVPKLEFLDLSGYKKSEMPDGSLQTLRVPRKFFIHGTKLRELNLSYKDLDPLPRNFFLGLFKAEKVHLRGCGLKFIEYLTFFPLQVRNSDSVETTCCNPALGFFSNVFHSFLSVNHVLGFE